jgi:hypothetical protein
MPAQAVQDLNAQFRAGRRPTVQNVGLLRRASHASPIDVASELDSGARRPSQLPVPPSVTTNFDSIFPVSDPTDPTASAAIIMQHASTAAATGSAATGSAAHGKYDPSFKPHDWPDGPDEEEYQTLPEELPCEDSEVPKKG